jgi:membrane fusion protein, adhesin transport system
MTSEDDKSAEYNHFDLRKFDLTRKYDDDFSPADGIPWYSHLLLYTIAALLVIFLLWANFAQLEEVARGDGQVVPSSEVQVIQSLEGGIIDAFPVKEGDRVEVGQVILRLRDVQAKSDLSATRQKYLGIMATLARLQAETEGKDEIAFPDDVLATVPESVAAEKDAFIANRKQRGDQVSVLEQQKSQREQEVAELRRRISDISSVMGLAQEERNMVAPMVERGAANKMELLQLDRQIAQQRAELNGLRLALPRSEAAVKEAAERINEVDSGIRAAAQKELAEKTIELNTIKETLSAYRDKSDRTEIKSPMMGIVQDIKINTVGGVAKAGEPIMEIVPLEDVLVVEARIKPADIAFIHEGQKAVVRLSAYDFSVYGAMDGKVTEISADSFTNDKGESFYRVRVSTDASKLTKNKTEYDIKPGMQATVDIITGEKTVMQYLLKPFVKASQTALRER